MHVAIVCLTLQNLINILEIHTCPQYAPVGSLEMVWSLFLTMILGSQEEAFMIQLLQEGTFYLGL